MVWSEEKIEYLKQNYSKYSAEELSKTLNTSINSVFQKAFKLKLKGRTNGSWNIGISRTYNSSDIEFIKQNYELRGASYCAKHLNKKSNSVQKIAAKLGLKANRSKSISNNKEQIEQLKEHARKYLKKHSEIRVLFTEKDKKLIIKLYKDGISSGEIAEIFECSKTTITNILKDIPKRRPGEYANRISEHQFGENNTSWKGGVKSVYDRFRGLNEYWNWRKAVLSRDGYKCTSCGTEKDLQAHHLKFLRLLVKEYCETNNKTIATLEEQDLRSNFFYDTANGLTLCKVCHKKWHKEHGR